MRIAKTFSDFGVQHVPRNVARAVSARRLVAVVVSAHKVGSTWLYGMIKDMGRFLSAPILPSRYVVNGTIKLEDAAIFSVLGRLPGYWIFKSHSLPPKYTPPESHLANIRFVTIVRDPRDVLVSAAHYLAFLDPKDGGWGSSFGRLSMKDRIATLLKEGQFLLDRLEQWNSSRLALKVRYERLADEPVQCMKEVAAHLGLNVSDTSLQRTIEMSSFEKQAKRKRGSEGADAFYRKGLPGDWVNHFDSDLLRELDEGLGGRWKKLLCEMGYSR